MKSEFEIAITQLCSDRNVSPEVIIEAIEAALVTTYKKNYGPNQNIRVTVDRRTGQARVFVNRLIVPKVEDADTQITLADARKEDPSLQMGEILETEVKPRNFGRIAAQTAKQVIMQRIREAERDSVYLEFADRVGELANGVVRSVDARSGSVTISLGRAEALLPRSEQIPGEYYRFNQRLRVYLSEVERTGHGPQVIASRSHKGLLRRLLELEVPEIYNGTVEIKAIAREAGSRSKVAVAALQPGVDPVGSCVGMRGVRIQNIVNELNGEKIDVVPWSGDDETFIASALSPAKVVRVVLDRESQKAKVVVPDTALSLAIGKEGQNARLAAKLTGWGIDIRSEAEFAAEAERIAEEAREAEGRAAQEEEARRAAAALLAEAEALIAAEEAPAAAEPSVAEEVAAEVSATGAAGAADASETEPAEVSAELEEPVAEVATFEEGAPETLVELTEDEGEALELEETEEREEGDEEGADRKRESQRRKDRKRVLEYDERLGEVVSRRRRKRDEKWRWGEDDF